MLLTRTILTSLIVLLLCLASVVRADLLDDVEDDAIPAEKKQSSALEEGSDEEKVKSATPVPQKPVTTKPSVDHRQTQKQKPGPGKVGVVKFWSKSLSGFKDKGSLILEEDVVVTQDDIRLEADKATIYFQQGGKDVREVHAVGSVKFSRTDPDTGEPIRAEGKEAFFSNAKRSVVLKGEPVLHRGSDIVRGKAIYYDLRNGWVKADRVEGVVQPATKKAGSR